MVTLFSRVGAGQRPNRLWALTKQRTWTQTNAHTDTHSHAFYLCNRLGISLGGGTCTRLSVERICFPSRITKPRRGMGGSDVNGSHQIGPCTSPMEGPQLPCTSMGRLSSNENIDWSQWKPQDTVFKLLTGSASPGVGSLSGGQSVAGHRPGLPR